MKKTSLLAALLLLLHAVRTGTFPGSNLLDSFVFPSQTQLLSAFDKPALVRALRHCLKCISAPLCSEIPSCET